MNALADYEVAVMLINLVTLLQRAEGSSHDNFLGFKSAKPQSHDDCYYCGALAQQHGIYTTPRQALCDREEQILRQ